MIVLVDSRERDLSYKLETLGIEHKRTNLVLGDVLIITENGEEYLFERKTITDFISSMMDGRLDNQLLRLMEHGNAYLILEMSGKIYSNINRQAVFSKIAKIAYLNKKFGKVTFIPSRNIMDTARIINYFYKHLEEEEEEIEIIRPKIKKKKSDILDWKIFILTGFPYIGNKRAKKLLEKYNGDLIAIIQNLPNEEDVPKNVREAAKEILSK